MSSVSTIVKTVGGMISRNAPSILAGLASAGIVTTAIFAVDGTIKAIELIKEEESARSKDSPAGHEALPLTNSERFKLTYRCFIPTAIIGVATIGCVIGSNSINLRRNAVLASLYTLADTSLKEYKDKVVETIGKNKEQKIRDDIASDYVQKNPPSSNQVIITQRGNVLCLDKPSEQYFRGDIEKIRQIANDINARLRTEMFISVNEFYYELGIKESKLGKGWGWDIDKGYLEIIPSSQLTPEGEPCLVIDYEIVPNPSCKR